MGKVLALFVLMAVFSLAVYWKNNLSGKTVLNETQNLSVTATPTPTTLGVSVAVPESSSVWESFRDDDLGLKIRYPKYLTVKKEKDNTLTISGEGIRIAITKAKVGTTDTINTLAEKDIDRKKTTLGDKFRLIDSISPVAIDSQTAIAFTTEEDTKEVTYFYVPMDPGYLLIADTTDPDRLSVSDNIIYSLEIL